MHRSLRLLTTCAAAALVLAACGGAEESTVTGRAGGRPTADARTIAVEASNFAFDPERIRIDMGEEVALRLHSIDNAHDFAVIGLGLVADVTGDETTTQRLRVDEAGELVFYCTIPGHRGSGMEGTLIVR